MAEPSGRRRIMEETVLQCAECGHRFEEKVATVPIPTVDWATAARVPELTGGEKCPECGSEWIGLPSGPQR